MCEPAGCRLPNLCIVPPHILRHLAERPARVPRRLAQWALHTLLLSERLRGARLVRSGLGAVTLPAGVKRRTIYDARGGELLPGTLVRSEGDGPVRDVAVNEAYDGAGATFDLYFKEYKRNSIDDRGMRLDSTVHYSQSFDNAFWDGRQMVYGDGDGQLFQRFTKALDVIGHELTHGVTQFEAALDYHNQSGALNESFSDVFGSLVKQRVLKQAARNADWLIGAGLFTPDVKGVALRSMKDPGTAYDDPRIGKDPQPAHMRDYVKTWDDNGGVHINSGIPNRAFYLAASAIGGYAWKKAGLVWYVALRDRLRHNAQFADAARATIDVAQETFGADSPEAAAVSAAWDGVGVAPAAKTIIVAQAPVAVAAARPAARAAARPANGARRPKMAARSGAARVAARVANGARRPRVAARAAKTRRGR